MERMGLMVASSESAPHPGVTKVKALNKNAFQGSEVGVSQPGSRVPRWVVLVGGWSWWVVRRLGLGFLLVGGPGGRQKQQARAIANRQEAIAIANRAEAIDNNDRQ